MKNIVLVTVDSLRADCCGFLDGPTDTTPFLDSLAQDGVVFENAIAPGPRTPSSMPVIFTGEFYEFNGHHMNDWRARRGEIANHFRQYGSLVKKFKQMGYNTVGFTANPWTAEDTNFDQGFDLFQELHPNNEEGINTLPNSFLVKGLDRLSSITGDQILSWNEHKEWFSHWTGYYNIIKDSLKSVEEPYFVWIFLMDSHHPYITPRKLRQEATTFDIYYSLMRFWRERHDNVPNHVGKMLKKAYRDTVRSADTFVNRICEDLFSETEFALVFHADHGESHGDHGMYGHEYQLFEENVRVPLLIYDGEQNNRIRSPTSLQDMHYLLETVARGREIREISHPQPVITKIESKQIARDRAEMLNYEPHLAAIRGDKWKYIRTSNSSLLFDITNDPGEQEDVSSEYTDVCEDLSILLTAQQNQKSERRRIVEASQTIVDESTYI